MRVAELCRMILDISPHNRSKLDFSIPIQGGAVDARLLKSSNRFTTYSSYTIELNFGKMILDISPHNRSEPDFLISIEGALCPLQYSNRFTAYSTYAIELNFGRMIVDISPHNRSEPDFRCLPRGRCGGAPLAIIKSIHSLQFLCD